MKPKLRRSPPIWPPTVYFSVTVLIKSVVAETFDAPGPEVNVLDEHMRDHSCLQAVIKRA
jgi:hypothetical protein